MDFLLNFPRFLIAMVSSAEYKICQKRVSKVLLRYVLFYNKILNEFPVRGIHEIEVCLPTLSFFGASRIKA
jgi:hypothetical protein